MSGEFLDVTKVKAKAQVSQRSCDSRTISMDGTAPENERHRKKKGMCVYIHPIQMLFWFT
jgi:hypothetical protein